MKRYANNCAAFHIGRGGKDYQPGHVEFLGTHVIGYYVKQCDIYPPESDEPGAEWTDCDENGVSLTNEMIRTGVGRIDIDGQYDTTYSIRIEDIMPDSPEWEALKECGSLEALETMYTALNPSDNRTLASLGEFILAVPEAWNPDFIINFCQDCGWSWIETDQEEAPSCDYVPIASDGERTLYIYFGPWEEIENYVVK